MKNFSKSNINTIIYSIILFVFLQIIDFGRNSYLPLIIGILKLLLFFFALIYIIIKIKPLKIKLVTSVIFVVLVYFSYQLSLWKITASIYISTIEEEYIEMLKTLEKDSTFTEIFYESENDSLVIWNNLGNSVFSEKDREIIKNFMIENKYIELWQTKYGVAFIYTRFIDNMSGLIYCPSKALQNEMENNKYEYKSYIKIRENWYYYSSSG